MGKNNFKIDNFVEKGLFFYLYQCQFIEGVMREILGLTSLTILLALGSFHDKIKADNRNKICIDLDLFQKIIHDNSFGKNLELFLLFTKDKKLYDKLNKHNNERKKYVHHFFEMANKYEFFWGKNEKKFSLFKKNLEKSIELAKECADAVVELREELINKYNIPNEVVLTKHKGWKDINGKQILFD